MLAAALSLCLFSRCQICQFFGPSPLPASSCVLQIGTSMFDHTLLSLITKIITAYASRYHLSIFLFLQLVDLSWWCCFGGNILAPFIFFYKRNSPWENIWISQIWDAVSHIGMLCHLCKSKAEAILYRSGFILISFIPFHLLTALFLLISAYLIMFLWLSCCFQNSHIMSYKSW